MYDADKGESTTKCFLKLYDLRAKIRIQQKIDHSTNELAFLPPSHFLVAWGRVTCLEHAPISISIKWRGGGDYITTSFAQLFCEEESNIFIRQKDRSINLQSKYFLY